MKRTSNHSEQRLFREEVLSFTRGICVCVHLTQTRDALEKCAEMGINRKQTSWLKYGKHIYRMPDGPFLIRRSAQRKALCFCNPF